MQTLKKSFIMLTCLALTASISSCLNDDNDNDIKYADLTPTQKAAQTNEMAGQYAGHIYVLNDTTMKRDSIPCQWRINASDSSLTVSTFPVSIASYGLKNEGARNIIKAAGTRPLRVILHPYSNTAFDQGYYTFTVVPDNYKFSFTTEYEEKAHNVEIEFAYQLFSSSYTGISSTLYAVGEYYKQEMNAYFLIKGIKIDDATYNTGTPTYIYGKK